MLAASGAAAVVVVIATILGAVELVRKAVATICRRWASHSLPAMPRRREKPNRARGHPRRDLGVGALPAGSFAALSDETWPRLANSATVVPQPAASKGGPRAYHGKMSYVQGRTASWSHWLLQRSMLPKSGAHQALARPHCCPATRRPQALAA